MTGIQNKGRTATVLLRGSNKMVLEEADRSLHDALCVIRCLVQKRFLIAGGSAPEVEVTHQLTKWSKTLQVGTVCLAQHQLLTIYIRFCWSFSISKMKFSSRHRNKLYPA